MFRIDEYVDELIILLKDTFGERLMYIGLQGSYLRNEETENSDIDIMAVIDNLSVEDLKTYQKALVSIGNFDKSCGFICGNQYGLALICLIPKQVYPRPVRTQATPVLLE